MKALIAGLGGIGQRHARNLRAVLGEGVELLAFRERGLRHVITPQLDVDATRDVAETYAIRTFTDLGEALAEKPDIAFVTNPSNKHIETAMACLTAGCDLFIEKPLSDSTEGVRQLIAATEDRGLIAMVGYQLRFHPCFIGLSRIVESGRLGNLLAVNASIGEYLPGWHRYEDYRQMYAARRDMGGGVVLSQIHEFDYLYALFGLPKRLFALGGHWSDLEIDVEDTASTLMECAVAGRPLPVHVHQDYLQRPPRRTCEVIGDAGRASLDFVNLTVTEQPAGSVETIAGFTGFDRNELFLDELRHFLACVRDRTQPLVGLRDGLASLTMALAVRTSIASQAVVELDPIEKDVCVA